MNDYADMAEWCVDCDDSYLDGDSDDGLDSCAAAGHHRLIDPTSDLQWVICDRCRGDGSLRGYPGVYTSDDFDEDPDLFDAYSQHCRPCEDCGGRGSVRDLTDEARERPAVRAWLREMNDLAAVEAAERRMGA